MPGMFDTPGKGMLNPMTIMGLQMLAANQPRPYNQGPNTLGSVLGRGGIGTVKYMQALAAQKAKTDARASAQSFRERGLTEQIRHNQATEGGRPQKAPSMRTSYEGDDVVEYQYDFSTRDWVEKSRAPRWKAESGKKELTPTHLFKLQKELAGLRKLPPSPERDANIAAHEAMIKKEHTITGRTEHDPGLSKPTVTGLEQQEHAAKTTQESIQKIIDIVKDPNVGTATGVVGSFREYVGGILQQIPGFEGLISNTLNPEEAIRVRTRIRDLTNQIVAAIEPGGEKLGQ